MCKQKSKTFYNLLMSITIYSSLSVGCIMNEGVEKITQIKGYTFLIDQIEGNDTLFLGNQKLN